MSASRETAGGMSDISPLPWTVGPFEGHVSTTDGRLVAGCRGFSTTVHLRSMAENDANARFIVKAANHHDALVSALKEIVGSYRLPDGCVHGHEPDYCDACRFQVEKQTSDSIRQAMALLAAVER